MENKKHSANNPAVLNFSPYKSTLFLAVFEGFSFFFLLVYMFWLDNGLFDVLIFLFLSMLALYFTWYFWELSNLQISVSRAGITLRTNKYNRKSYAWNDFAVAYIMHDFKGFRYLLLASNEMDKQTCRKIINLMMVTIKNGSLCFSYKGNVGFRVHTHLDAILEFIETKVKVVSYN